MKTIHVMEKTDKNGALCLHIPLGKADTEFEVVLVVQPKISPEAPQGKDWPPGYFERTFGSIDDETFVRPPQGEMPKVAELD